VSKDKIEVNMNVYDIPILVEALEEANKEIERLNNINKNLEKTLELNHIRELQEENERLNNILDGIENNMLSIIYKNIPVIYKEYDLLNQDVKKYFKELKGEDKEWK